MLVMNDFGMFSAESGMSGIIITSKEAILRFYDVAYRLHYIDFSPLYIIITAGWKTFYLEKSLT